MVKILYPHTPIKTIPIAFIPYIEHDSNMPSKTSARMVKYYQRLEQGLCPRCGGKVKKTSPHKYCEDCRSYYREYGNAISEKVKAIRNKKYALRKKKHQCPRCGKQLAKSYTKTLCATCLAKARANNNK
jgi:rRNA maturation endonuclease Nob1